MADFGLKVLNMHFSSSNFLISEGLVMLIHKSWRVVAGTSMVEHNIKGLLKKKKMYLFF